MKGETEKMHGLLQLNMSIKYLGHFPKVRIIRWAVSNTDHLIFLLKSPLFIIYLFIYFSYFDPLFCVQNNLKMAQSNVLKFGTHMYRHMNKAQQSFQP